MRSWPAGASLPQKAQAAMPARGSGAPAADGTAMASTGAAQQQVAGMWAGSPAANQPVTCCSLVITR